MTDEDTTRIAKPTPGVDDKPEEDKPESISMPKKEYLGLMKNYGKAHEECTTLGNENSRLRIDLTNANTKYDTFTTQAEQEKKQLRKRPYYTGLMGVVVGAGIAAAILGSTDCSCSGGVGSLRSSYRSKEGLDAGVVDTDASDAGVSYGTGPADAGADASINTLVCPAGESCYSQDLICDDKAGNDCYNTTDVTGLETRLEKCGEDLKACKDELKKRPKNCPTYTPRACTPVKECQEIPYLRRGK